MARDYIFGFNPTKVPESFERPDHIPEFIHGPRPNIVPSQDNKVISYYEEIIRLKRAMDALQSELEDIIRSQIPDYDISNANNVLSVNEDGTKMEWKPATSASGVSASVEQTETGATITITDASGTTTATVENGEPGDPGFSPSARVEQTATGATITVTDKSGTTTADILNGKGEKGDPGFSPSASVAQTETGATVTVTDETGTTTAELKNGKDGVGLPGQDGFSPSASVTQTDTGATVTVTDKTGTTTANLANGAPGPTGKTPYVTATATVNDSQGTPSVEVTKTGTDEAPAFNFAFSGLKGETGEGTKGDDGFSPIANVQQTDTGATITVTDKSGTTTATVENGTDGVTPNVSATATVDNTTGTPSVQVTKSGTAEAPAFNFAFTGIKGSDGQSIAGPGVPAGGTAGQVLTKKSGTDYDTEWKDPTGGGTGHQLVAWTEHENDAATVYPLHSYSGYDIHAQSVTGSSLEPVKGTMDSIEYTITFSDNVTLNIPGIFQYDSDIVTLVPSLSFNVEHSATVNANLRIPTTANDIIITGGSTTVKAKGRAYLTCTIEFGSDVYIEGTINTDAGSFIKIDKTLLFRISSDWLNKYEVLKTVQE